MTQRQGQGVPISGDDVFLTPRIIDRLAFEEYAQQLRGLIHQASGEGNALRHALLEVKSFDQSAKAITGELARRLEAVTRLIPAIDERLAKLEALATAAFDQAALARNVEIQVDELIARKLDAAVQQMANVSASFDARCAEVESRLRGAWSSSTHDAEQAAAMLAQRVAQASAELESRMREQVAPAESRLVEASRLAQALLERVEGSLPQLQERIEQAGMQIDERLHRVTTGLEKRIEQIKAEVAVATGPAITNLNLLCHRAVDVLGIDPRAAVDADAPPAHPGSLTDIVLRAEHAIEHAAGMAQQVEQERRHLEACAGRLDRLRQAAHDAERACERIEAILAHRRADIAAVAAIPGEQELADLAQRATELRDIMADAANHHRAAERAAARTTEALARSEALTARLRELEAMMDLAESRVRDAMTDAQRQVGEVDGAIAGAAAHMHRTTVELEQRLEAAAARTQAILDDVAQASEPVNRPAREIRATSSEAPPVRSQAKPRAKSKAVIGDKPAQRKPASKNASRRK
ncbi:MAG: hypothetical protein KF866_12855 [Phycisphaeraceae bacterium]|nr:hypothetical protein [Phycisphaeraceae bacterium]